MSFKWKPSKQKLIHAHLKKFTWFLRSALGIHALTINYAVQCHRQDMIQSVLFRKISIEASIKDEVHT